MGADLIRPRRFRCRTPVVAKIGRPAYYAPLNAWIPVCAAQDRRVDVVRAFERVDRLHVDRLANDSIRADDAVAAEPIARKAGDVQRIAGVVALDRRDRLRRWVPLIAFSSYR